ncbi:MAG TPA: hypothetical protein VM241_05790 [Candidatus Thermoplasmatota archaeon]|nr:hypothetical protein [Candidatus Thermoplasmatota archaeon]
MMRTLLVLAFLLPLSGCLTHSASTTSTAPTTAPTTAPGSDGAKGADGAPGGPASPPAQGLTRKEILSQDFSINSAQPGPPIAVQVPTSAAKVLLALDYQAGAYKDASFTLGACKNVSPITGTAASVAGADVQNGGTVNRGVQYDCGKLEGAQQVTWSLTGTLRGHITVYADVPA